MNNAAPPSILRASNKDRYITNHIFFQLKDLIQLIKGARFTHTYTPQLKSITRLLYLTLTTLSGTRTLGEEYTQIFQVTTNNELPAKWRLGVYVFVSSFYKLLFEKTKLPLQSLLSLHKALFYLQGLYYEFPKRLLKLKYLTSVDVNASYEFIGVLMLAKAGLELFTKINKRNEEEDEELEEEEEDEEGETCKLCYDTISTPTVTLCGHLYCWSCIWQWCREHHVCPLCRQECHEQHLLVLRT